MPIHRVQCFVRVRPLLEGEKVTRDSEEECFFMTTDEQRVLIGHHYSYRFDRVFDPTVPLHHICNTVVVGMVQEALKGVQKALLLYGPTGGGKSYTMSQLIPVALQLLLQAADSERLEYETIITMECVQIYLECISDLIDSSKNDLQLREFPDTGVYVRGAAQMSITSLEEFDKVWKKISTSRFCTTTSLNGTRSRGHCVVNLRVKRRRRIVSRFEEESCLKDDSVSSSYITDGSIYFVDFAGIEQPKESDTNTISQRATIKIDRSLSVLSNVMSALADPEKKHVPFRDSKLTRLLQEPLGREGKSNILLCISQSPIKIHDTGRALAFGVKAMSIVQQYELKKSIDHTSYFADVQHWLSNRVHMLEEQLRLLTQNNTRQCNTCIEKEIKMLEISQELSTLKAQTIHTEKEYNVTVSRLRHYKKSMIIDETSNERKLRALNEYWTGYTGSLQQDLETAELERDEACAELSKLTTEITQLRQLHTKTREAKQIEIKNTGGHNNEFVYINIDQHTIEGNTAIDDSTIHSPKQKERKKVHTGNRRATQDSATLRAELSESRACVVKQGEKRGSPNSASTHCRALRRHTNEGNEVEPSIGTGREYFCCWRSMLSSVVDRCEGSWRSFDGSSNNMLTCEESPSINVSKVVRRELSSMDSTPFVVRDLGALF
ncbi:Kinesin motor domain [Trypanosoma melophagium]|uniref:Kinesin motor domain n=1 Tax=Trypanosoma melophagium TaxID=715481 RepID=UPI00351A7618|nr:Kinesin motor domain [Trypanosoma melophagium]